MVIIAAQRKVLIITMKKLVLLAAIIVLAALALTACGNGDDNDVPVESPPVVQEPSDPSGSGSESEPAGNDDPAPDVNVPSGPSVFSFIYRDVEINLDQDVDEIILSLGAPTHDDLVPSCAFDGEEDRLIAFPGIEIDAYPSRDSDDFLIFNIVFFDDTVRTAEGGVRLGNSIQSVFEVYGDDYDYDAGMYRFTRGSTILEFLVDDNDEIISIAYRLDMSIFGV